MSTSNEYREALSRIVEAALLCQFGDRRSCDKFDAELESAKALLARPETDKSDLHKKLRQLCILSETYWSQADSESYVQNKRSDETDNKRVALMDEILALLARPEQSFQHGVDLWMASCFGDEIASDKQERNHRFLEEALEVVQACGCTRSEAMQLVDYVFARPVGECSQEVGGAMVTLAALCNAQQLDMQVCGDSELARVWTAIHKIRAKQLAKPKHSPLPESAEPAAAEKARELEIADMPTPKAQQGTWTLTAPDGREWQGESPLKCAASEQRERVPADIAVARIMRALADLPSPPAATGEAK